MRENSAKILKFLNLQKYFSIILHLIKSTSLFCVLILLTVCINHLKSGQGVWLRFINKLFSIVNAREASYFNFVRFDLSLEPHDLYLTYMFRQAVAFFRMATLIGTGSILLVSTARCYPNIFKLTSIAHCLYWGD